ncbi:hypothetical protein J1N35_044049, partial [Gossypium stocksii]
VDHVKLEFWKLQNKIKRDAKNNKKDKQKVEVDDTSVAEDRGDNFLLVLTSESSHRISEWTLGSRCSYHMCPNKDWFSTYSSVKDRVVLMGNKSLCKISRIETIQIRMQDEII